MPRFAQITGIRHGEKDPVIIEAPSNDVNGIRAAFKNFSRERAHEEFARVQMLHSDAGVIAECRLKMPKAPSEAPAPAQSAPVAETPPEAMAAEENEAVGDGERPRKRKRE